MHYDREKALAKGKRREKTFIHVFCGAFILVGVILLIAGIGVSVSDHSFRQKAEPVEAVILAMRGVSHESLGTPVYVHAQRSHVFHASGQSDYRLLPEGQSAGSALLGFKQLAGIDFRVCWLCVRGVGGGCVDGEAQA